MTNEVPPVDHCTNTESPTTNTSASGHKNATALPRLLSASMTALFVGGLLLLAFIFGQASVPKPPESPHGEHHADEIHGGEDTMFICPMHPQIRQPDFGTCPICHMDLVPVASGGQDQEPVVRLTHAQEIEIGLRTEAVQRVPLTHELHVFGRIEVAEDQEAAVTAWTSGRLDKLAVRHIGSRIESGQRLATLYSPEVLAAQQNLIQAQQAWRRASATASPSAVSLETAVEAGVTRLERLGLSPAFIRRLRAEERVRDHVEIRAAVSGTVVERHRDEGDWVQTGDRIFTLAGLDTVWIQLEIFERDLAYVKVGQWARIKILGHEQELSGQITFIDPTIDMERRIVRARVELDNHSGTLRPGASVDAHLVIPIDEDPTPLSVPASAILWTGPRSLLFLYDGMLSPPGYIPIEVKLGPRYGDRVVVREGVFETEQVVVHGTFRLDSSLQILGGPSMMRQAAERQGTTSDRAHSTSGGHHAH